MELTHCKDTRVGDTFNKLLSGGECKRLCIGIELIANPTILFLDEPTTGLDVHSAELILNILSSLANMGRIVISVIH